MTARVFCYWPVVEPGTYAICMPRPSNALVRLPALAILIRHVGDLHAAISAVEECGRVTELGLVLLKRVALHDVFRAEPHVHVTDHCLEQLVVDVALMHDVASGDQPALGGHDA